MEIFILVGSVVVIAAGVTAARRLGAAPASSCPICIGTALTWLLSLLGMAAGVLPSADYQLPTALLMGGSVVGITYQLEKRLLKLRPNGSTLFFKAASIAVGFIAFYGLVANQFLQFGFAFVTWILFIAFVLRQRKSTPASEDAVKKLENKMKQCC